MTADIGPFKSMQEADSTPAARKAHAESHARYKKMGPGCHVEPNARIVFAALEAAGVRTTEWEDSIVRWLGGFGAYECQVFAGFIARAHETQRQPEPEPGTRTEWAVKYGNYGAGGTHVQPYPTEADAREAKAEIGLTAPAHDPRLMRCTVGPWKEVPDA